MSDTNRTNERSNEPDERTQPVDETTTDRRTMLKAGGTALAAGAGLTASTGSAAAVSTFDVEVREIDSGWSGPDPLPVVDELFVFIHGWFGDSTVRSQAADVAEALEDGGYEPDEYIGIQWDATTINFIGATAETENVGEIVAGLAEDFYDGGGGNIRLVGHSLGGRAVLETINALEDGYEIETVAPLGAAANGDMVCDVDGTFADSWYDGIADNAGEVRNYHSENDSTVGAAYGGLTGNALGADGSDCPDEVADTYADIDVTDSVGNHFAFLGDDLVGEDLAAAIVDGEGADHGEAPENGGGWW
ncbi:alpha/beta hydrolase [Salinadaptatus halalkaliphilus]|uniref:Alpha/beta hydrolase n=1 Tax=Salinadaptatus halalkaliphilus TaxID=2419781 RepID=A0A4S3TIE9_9EURY|nr:alpha/beta hydrolase [Salinadaptatus halalkaliphilus]THE63799.1 alpha/beta hydrolase [Salinadaptatus halalkaliphilus]